jgi:Tol biopolymer transport system component
VFTSERDGTLANWICNADGSNLRRLSEIQRGGTPSWSPDGTRIVFDDRAGGRSHIYVMPAEGGTPVQLTGDDFDGHDPSWSADGNWIYFSSTRTGTSEIWKVSLRNKETVQVTRHGGSHAQESADGKFVYYDKPIGIWVMPTAGGPERMILSDPDISIFWHVNPEGIYYVVDAKPHPRVQLYHFATKKVTTVGHLDKFAWGAPGLGISPDGRTLLYAQVDSDTADLMLVKNGKW